MVIFIISAYFLASFIAPVYAAPGDPYTISQVVDVLERIINLLAPAAGIAFFFMMIIGGFQFLNSGGDPKAAGAARTTLTYAILGIILVVASWLILQIIKSATGVDVTTVNLPN
ncbi:MAG: hypothetical protein Q8P25_00060 [Candidatus Curtissbacteria bacterium]|nr:hypothetical protein [Candidatus Curtissbacteria bacterium]